MRLAKREIIAFICVSPMKITQQHLFKTATQPITGGLLLAEPFLNEPYFQRAVILLIEHNEEESMGLVLNHPSDIQTNHAIEGIDFEMRLYFGGPVDTQRLVYLHNYPNITDAKQITPHLFFGGDWEQLVQQIERDKHPQRNVRFFSGYAGWGPFQLNDEIAEHAWVCVTNYNDQTLLSQPSDTLWHQTLVSQGKKLAAFAHFPLNISDN